MTEITYDILKDYLLKLAANEGHRTAACYYSVETRDVVMGVAEFEEDAATPCCIVGRTVFDFTGVEGLRELFEGQAVEINGNFDRYTNAGVMLELGFTKEAIALASRVQWMQDRGMTWSKAVANALAFDKDLTHYEFAEAVMEKEDNE